MSEMTDAEREQIVRNRAFKYAGERLGSAAQDREFLLRLLDAERARADAAEAKVADAWNEAYLEGYRDRRLERDYDPTGNPYRKA